MMPRAPSAAEARESLELVQEISNLLNTGLDAETLAICIQLLELGINPEALANIIIEIKRSVAEVKASDEKEASARDLI